MSRLALFLSIALAGCTPTHFQVEPYRNDAGSAAALANRAQQWCYERRGGSPEHPFTSDGCSMSPDGDWAECCVEHDIAYWCGGSADDRRAADRRLAACIVARGHSKFLGELVRLGVSLGGAPWEPFPWRWGYGASGINGYSTPPSQKPGT